jgi:hypothetical protein
MKHLIAPIFALFASLSACAPEPMESPSAGETVDELLRGRGQRRFKRWHARCQEDGCCDDTNLTCDRPAPSCKRGSELAIQDGCWTCVDPDTCELPCGEGEAWDPQVGECCPEAIYIADCWCDEGWTYNGYEDRDEKGCLLGYACECLPPSCDDGSEVMCAMAPPTCAPGLIAAEKRGCWECVDPTTCEPPANCDDGSPTLCDMLPPECGPGLIPAAQNGCYTCVDPQTCEPRRDCNDGTQPLCDRMTPECRQGLELVVQDSCETCVDPRTCEPPSCDDGSTLQCRMLPPTCPADQVLALQEGCWHCVYPDTCKSEPECGFDAMWDPALGACCPTVFFVADCIPCEDGQSPVGESVYDDNGCYLGSTCSCQAP